MTKKDLIEYCEKQGMVKHYIHGESYKLLAYTHDQSVTIAENPLIKNVWDITVDQRVANNYHFFNQHALTSLNVIDALKEYSRKKYAYHKGDVDGDIFQTINIDE